MNRIAALALALLCSAIAVHGGTVDECFAADLAAAKTLSVCSAEAPQDIQDTPGLSQCEQFKYRLPCTTKSDKCTDYKVIDYCGAWSSAASLRASFML